MACLRADPRRPSPELAALPRAEAAPKPSCCATEGAAPDQLGVQALLAAAGGVALLRCALGAGASEASLGAARAAGAGGAAGSGQLPAARATASCQRRDGAGPERPGPGHCGGAAGRQWAVGAWSTGPRPTVCLPAPAVRTAWAGVAAPRRAAPPPAAPPGTGLLDLPSEVLQTVVDWLPTFHERVRAGRAARALQRLDWRWGPPRQVPEELSRMGLGDRGAAAVAAALSSPLGRGLGELSLAENGIGDAGACAIARALEAGAGIRRLSLRDNAIGDVGAEALAEALSRSATVEEVDLWGNQISNIGKAAIQRKARCDAFLEVDPVHPAGAGYLTASMGKVRSVLFEWIAQVHSGMQMPSAFKDDSADPQDMLFRTYRHVDAYVSHYPVQRTELQLAAVACTVLASGYSADQNLEDDLQLSSWLNLVTDGTCTPQQVQSMLGQVQGALGFRLCQPTAYTFLRRFLRRTGWTDESFSLANYLIELAALDPAFLAFKPQATAAAAAVLSRQYAAQGVGVKRTPRWKAKLLQSAQVELQAELAGCIASLASLHKSQQPEQSNFVNRKYSWEALHSVAKIKPNMPVDPLYYVEYMMS